MKTERSRTESNTIYYEPGVASQLQNSPVDSAAPFLTVSITETFGWLLVGQQEIRLGNEILYDGSVRIG